jgi:hypothetical protein
MRARRLFLGVAILAVLAASARAQVPPETGLEKPHPGEEPRPEFEVPEKRGAISLVPVPVLYADPNIGVGAGVMPVGLYHPERRVELIFAPSVDYNQVLGVSFASRVLYYPTLLEELDLFNSITTKSNTEQSLRFHGHDRWIPLTDFDARGYYIIDGTHRFYGIGARTSKEAETDYTLKEYGADGDFGYRFWDVLRVGGTLRYRNTFISRGIISSTPDTVDRFPRFRDSAQILAPGAHLTLDLRDNVRIPNDGLLGDAYVEYASREVVSESRFTRYGAQLLDHYPIIRPGFWVNVIRLKYAGVDHDRRFPFWELPSLGGSENLRGFGVGRFTDREYIVASIEERVRFAEAIIMDNLLVAEIAPFFDFGRVFGSRDPLSVHSWQPVPGVGFRLLLPDSGIVARMDIGVSRSEGPAVFIVLGYPF